MKSAASESHLNESQESFLSPKDKLPPGAGSKFSLRDKLAPERAKDVKNKKEMEKKSKFNLFKKGKSRDASPNQYGRSRSAEYGMSARTGNLALIFCLCYE